MARYTNKIDTKGRVFVPSKLRDSMGKSIVVTLSLDSGYLSAYTEERFSRIREQFEALNSMDPQVRRVIRLIIGEALVCELDAQGRISISTELWDHIGVQGSEEICIIDLGDKLDICAKTFYERKKEELSSVMDLDLTGYNVTGL
jgi:MraZ protein